MTYIYVRRSTSGQNDTSFEAQERACRRWVSEPITVITETGSGADNDRPELTRMLTQLKSGDSVCIYDNSRLSRNMMGSILLLNTITEKGAVLICDGKVVDPNNPLELFSYHVHSAFADLQRTLQRQKTLEGIKQKRLDRDWVPSSLFGYTIIHGKHPKVTINESEAKWVRYAFTQFTNGKTYRQIALEVSRQLNRTLTTGRITEWIRQPQYMGFYTEQTIRHPSERTKFYLLPRPEMESQLIKSNLIPGIVSPEDWWRAREVELQLREKGTRKEYWNRHRTHFLLTGLLTCRECGCAGSHISRTQKGKFHQGYEIVNHQPYCSVDNKVIEASLLENLVCASYFITLLSYQNTAQFFAEESNRIQTETEELRKRLQSVEDLISQNKKKVNKYMDLFEDTDLESSDFADRLKKLKEEGKKLEEQKHEIESDISLKEADISEMLGELTEDRIQDFIHFDTSKKNLMIHSVCDSMTVSKTDLVISFKNGMSYQIKLNEKYKPWPKKICIIIQFKGEYDFEAVFDTETLEVSYEPNDKWDASVNNWYCDITNRVNTYLKEIHI